MGNIFFWIILENTEREMWVEGTVTRWENIHKMTPASAMQSSNHFRQSKTIQEFYFLFPYEQDDQRDTRRFMLYLGSELNRSRVIISPCLHVQTRIRLDHRSAPIHRIFFCPATWCSNSRAALAHWLQDIGILPLTRWYACINQDSGSYSPLIVFKHYRV